MREITATLTVLVRYFKVHKPQLCCYKCGRLNERNEHIIRSSCSAWYYCNNCAQKLLQ